jgi:LPXTG-motif cell wall-anchored protein
MLQVATLARRISTALVIGMLGVALLPSAVTAQDKLDCKDFKSRAEAQAKLKGQPGDPNKLDANNDGRACENFPYATSGSSSGSSSSGQLASTGFNAWELAALGIAGLGGAAVLGRRARQLS